MGIVQHHDAITGTERQHVADDYVQRLSEGVDAAIVSEKIRIRNSYHSITISLLENLLSIGRNERSLF
jgi:hypothetical protein